jgi:hypothetical protein
MKNALLDVSALDVEKKSDIDPNSLLAWLRSQSNVEDRRRSLYATNGPYTPNTNLLSQWNQPGGPLSGSNDPLIAAMGPELDAARMQQNGMGRAALPILPSDGRDDYDWRMATSDQFLGKEPKPSEMLTFAGEKASTNPLLNWLRGALSSGDPAAVERAMQVLERQVGGHNNFVERARLDARNAVPSKEPVPQRPVPAILGIRG